MRWRIILAVLAVLSFLALISLPPSASANSPDFFDQKVVVTVWGETPSLKEGEQIIVGVTNGKEKQYRIVYVASLPSPRNFRDSERGSSEGKVKGYLVAFEVYPIWSCSVTVQSGDNFIQKWRWPFWPWGVSWKIDLN